MGGKILISNTTGYSYVVCIINEAFKLGRNVIFHKSRELETEVSQEIIIREVSKLYKREKSKKEPGKFLREVYRRIKELQDARENENYMVFIWLSYHIMPSCKTLYMDEMFTFSISGPPFLVVPYDGIELNGVVHLPTESPYGREVIGLDLNNYRNAEEAMFGLQIAHVLEERKC